MRHQQIVYTNNGSCLVPKWAVLHCSFMVCGECMLAIASCSLANSWLLFGLAPLSTSATAWATKGSPYQDGVMTRWRGKLLWLSRWCVQLALIVRFLCSCLLGSFQALVSEPGFMMSTFVFVVFAGILLISAFFNTETDIHDFPRLLVAKYHNIC